jgi:hypothetical protein
MRLTSSCTYLGLRDQALASIVVGLTGAAAGILHLVTAEVRAVLDELGLRLRLAMWSAKGRRR